MSGFIDKVRQKMLDQKKKAMIKALKEKVGSTSYSGGTGKKIISANETVVLNAKTTELINAVKEEVSSVNKSANLDPEVLLKYIEEQGTKVYRIKNASNLLSKINEHTGFITPMQGTKAVYINTLIGAGMGMASEAMFIVSSEKQADYYLLLREFYLWCSFKKKLGGFEFTTQEVFKKYMNEKKNPAMSKLKYPDMCALQEALARDSEANEFVMQFVRQKEGSAKVLKKMKEGGAEI